MPAPRSAPSGQVEAYVARFNAEESAAGYLPSPTLGRLLAALHLGQLRAARARRRRAAKGNPFAFEKAREGTAAGAGATLRRKQADQLAVLLRKGHISRHQHAAGLEIREAYAAISRSLFRKQTLGIRVDVSRRERLPLELWSPREARLIRTRYGPWKAAMRAPVEVRLANGRRVAVGEALGLVMDLVWDNLGPRQLDDRHGLRPGTARRVLAAGLGRYRGPSKPSGAAPEPASQAPRGRR